ncbi:dermonecrotic toxin domain-containing protein [Pseudomonas sp. NPDC090233]|uniref:dermonecrotic toxin domain-containing protein n=1 Tax=Pseudomonas sp. NPDC090233 TaxID=3364479 RepID=UPI00383A18B1
MSDPSHADNTAYLYADGAQLSTLSDSSHLQNAARSSALLDADQRRQEAAKALHAVCTQAPTLRNTLLHAVTNALGLDPSACGLRNGESQVTMLTFAARVYAAPDAAEPFANWQTWGLDADVGRASWAGSEWTAALAPVVANTLENAQADYWGARMAGTAKSRQAYLVSQLREHFMACQDIAFGLDKIGVRAWAQGRQHPAQGHTLVQWRHTDGTDEACATTLLFAPTAQQGQWLLYRPEANTPVRSFRHQQALLDWMHEHRKLLWPRPAAALEEGSDHQAIILSPLNEDGFSRLALLMHSENLRLALHHLHQATQLHATDPLPWNDIEAWELTRYIQPALVLPSNIRQSIDEQVAEDTALALQELHFDSLPDSLPSGWHKQRIERQEDLLARYLGNDLAANSASMETLRSLQSRLDAVQSKHEQLLSDLPATLNSAVWGQRYGESSRFDQLSEAFRQALQLEAKLQNLLGELPATHLNWVEQLCDMPEPSLQRHVRPCTLQLVTGTQAWHLSGFLTLHHSDPQDSSLLLYKPGDNGGLMAFEDSTQLTERVLDTLRGCFLETLLESIWPQDLHALLTAMEDLTQAPAIVFKAIDTHVFDYCTQTLIASLTHPDDSAAPVSREAASKRLRISANQARLQAFARHAERNRTANLLEQLHPLRHLDLPQRTHLAEQVEALRKAMLANARLLDRDLPERGQFTIARLEQRLRDDFAPGAVPAITLNIADRVFDQRVSLGESGQANAFKLVKAFSHERSDVALEHLLPWALDDDLTLRLGNATIAFEGGSDDEALRRGVNQSYIANLITELDIAGAYERQILQTFQGQKSETRWQAELRRETLCAPFAKQLGIIAASRHPGLYANGQQLLERFVHEQLTAIAARTVDYHTLELNPGVATDGSSNATTLNGIFVLKAGNGPVLLLLPEAPNNRIVSQYDDAAQACRALADMAVDEAMLDYLAGLPIDGNASAHRSYIRTALIRNFSGFIGLGITRDEPLPTLLANLQMGRLVLSNRATSRSQSDLYLQTEAVCHGQVYDYIKMALGFIPLVGTVVGLYDGWHAATASVEAYLRGDTRAGIEHLNSVFLCLTEALLDLTPAVLFNNPASAARLSTGQRQRLATPLSVRSNRHHSTNPFKGYESAVPTGRWTNHPLPQGAGVYRHVDTGVDFITRQGQYYPVQWDDTYRTWRLAGNDAITYKQPVKRTAQGSWETHGRLSGQLIEDGLAGGGAQLSALYNRGWTTLRGVLRRQPAIISPRDVLLDIHRTQGKHRVQVKTSVEAYNQARGIGPDGPTGAPAAEHIIARARQKATEHVQAYVTFGEQSLERLRSLRAHLKRLDYNNFQQELAVDLSKQNILLMRLHDTHLKGCFARSQQLQLDVDDLLPSEVPGHLKTVHDTYAELAESLHRFEADIHRHEHIRGQLKGAELTAYDLSMHKLNIHLVPIDYRLLEISARIASIMIPRSTVDYEFFLLLRNMNREIVKVRSALFSQADMRLTVLSRRDEARLMAHLKERYQRFQAHLQSWQDNFPDYLSPSAVQHVDQGLAGLTKEIDIRLNAATPARRANVQANRGASRPRLFETVDDQLLIGREASVDGQNQIQINQPVDNFPHATFTPNADGRWQSVQTPPQRPTASLAVLEHTANSRLAKVSRQMADLQRYKGLNMLPRDLQDLAQGHAASLRDIADDLIRKAGNEIKQGQRTLVQRLEQSAHQLDTLGRTLRIEQIKAGQQPSIAHLEYLKEQGEIELRWSRELTPAKDNQAKPVEYLEEYVIHDSRTHKPLWYAHFHFKRKPAHGFARLEAGHLKLASQRNQRADVWRGPLTQAQAEAHFGDLRPATP